MQIRIRRSLADLVISLVNRLEVLHQMVLLFEPFVANDAEELTFFSAVARVVPHGLLVEKDLPTHATGEDCCVH